MELNNGIATRMTEAIVDYLYETAEGKISVAEAVGILEFAKMQIIEDSLDEEVE